MQIDYYVVLNVPPNATTAQIVTAYRGLARLYHPDTNKDPNANLRMQVINEAYRILSNPIERAHYDANHVLKKPSIQVIYPPSQDGDNPWSTYPSDLPPDNPSRSQRPPSPPGVRPQVVYRSDEYEEIEPPQPIQSRREGLTSTSSHFPSAPQSARFPSKTLRDSPFYRSAINRRRAEPPPRSRGERRLNRIVLGLFILTMLLALAVLADQIPSSSAIGLFLFGIALVISINLILDPPYR